MQTEGGGGETRQRRNALSKPKQDESGDAKAELVQNPDKNKDWILSPDEDYKKVFPRPIWSENPSPDLLPLTRRSSDLRVSGNRVVLLHQKGREEEVAGCRRNDLS